jgi:predicted XRE-type DNA-binding protein
MTDGEEDSGNVLAGLAPDALKAKLVRRIGKLIAEAELTHAEAAARMGMSEADLSKMLDGKVEALSIEQLVGFLTVLRQSVTVA